MDELGSQGLSFAPLTPVSFLDRARVVHGERVAVVDGDQRFTYYELWDRSRRLAGALGPMAHGRPVAVLAPNTHVMLEAHYGVPWAGTALLALNTRLTASELAYIVDHAEAGVLLYDHSLASTAEEMAALCGGRLTLIRIGGPGDEYESMLAASSGTVVDVIDERSLLALNYTSGTTGKPKGVMFHHRGAYLQSLAMVAHTGLSATSKMLWTLPMFHCNGWCFTWAVTAAGAVHVCLPKFDAEEAWRLIGEEEVTHLNGAPTVLTSLANAKLARPLPAGRRLKMGAGGSPPMPALLAQLSALGIDVTHFYGLTETFGPAVINDWHPEWDQLDAAAQARLKARQGVANLVSCPVRVVDEHGGDVTADGATVGEVALRGNNVMLGYFKDPEATRAAAPDGWFRSGDLGVIHPDGYIELRDRSKDVIISGGENISSIEVEQVVATHPAVLEVAVVAVPDERWGEVPAAYVTLRPEAVTTEDELIGYVRDRIAHFKAPKTVIFGDLPKTATGKIQKFLLRESAWQGREQRIN